MYNSKFDKYNNLRKNYHYKKYIQNFNLQKKGLKLHNVFQRSRYTSIDNKSSFESYLKINEN